jgi:hypothetical protein
VGAFFRKDRRWDRLAVDPVTAVTDGERQPARDAQRWPDPAPFTPMPVWVPVAILFAFMAAFAGTFIALH